MVRLRLFQQRIETRFGLCHGLRNDLLCLCVQIRPQDSFDDRLILLSRHIIDPKTAAQLTPQLLLHGKIHVAGLGHIASGNTGGGELQLIKVLFGGVRLI